jgi:activating signal cointegrator complex subunit 1
MKLEKLLLSRCNVIHLSNKFSNCLEPNYSPIIEEFGSIDLKMEGLEYMNDDPHSVDVVYGKVRI